MKKILLCLWLCMALSAKESAGELFILPVLPTMGQSHLSEVKQLVKDHHIGGLIFMQGDRATQRAWIAEIQEVAPRPLLIAQDAEWGPAMRLAGELAFPKNLTLGAIRDEGLLLEAGRGIGRACRRAGVHLNFAPVVDVNSNPQNPVIHQRALGDEAEAVARKGVLLMQGMKQEGLLTCAKHFPGHGDTKTDSHLSLPYKTRILAGHYDGTSIFHRDRWNTLLGLQFENLVINNTNQLYKYLNISPGDVLRAGPFFQKNSTKCKGCQIDLLIQTYHRILYLVEIKFSQNEIKNEVKHEMQEKIDRLNLPKGFSIKPVLIHVNGVSESLYLDRFFAHILDFSDLLKDD